MMTGWAPAAKDHASRTARVTANAAEFPMLRVVTV
jgi:hypothetical protein